MSTTEYIEPNYEGEECDACEAIGDPCDFHLGFIEGAHAQAEAVKKALDADL